MDTLEVRLLDEWFSTIRKFGTYNRKRWPALTEAKAIMRLCLNFEPRQLIEIGTGNGVTASYVATTGTKVITIDIADLPKVYLDETFPLKNLQHRIQFTQRIDDGYLEGLLGQSFWFIDGNPTLKSFNAYYKTVRSKAKINDMVIFRDLYNSELTEFDHDLIPFLRQGKGNIQYMQINATDWTSS